MFVNVSQVFILTNLLLTKKSNTNHTNINFLLRNL